MSFLEICLTYYLDFTHRTLVDFYGYYSSILQLYLFFLTILDIIIAARIDSTQTHQPMPCTYIDINSTPYVNRKSSKGRLSIAGTTSNASDKTVDAREIAKNGGVIENKFALEFLGDSLNTHQNHASKVPLKFEDNEKPIMKTAQYNRTLLTGNHIERNQPASGKKSKSKKKTKPKAQELALSTYMKSAIVNE